MHGHGPTTLAGRDLTSVRDLEPGEMLALLRDGLARKATRALDAPVLRGKTLALLFEKPSLRTRVSFDVGIHALGGHALYLSPAEVGLGRRESVEDVGRTLDRMVDGIVIRTFAHATVERLAEVTRVPVINALSDFCHPCQALADYMTILEVKDRVEGIRLAYVGDANNVANSLMFGAARLGVEIALASPPGYGPAAPVLDWCRTHAADEMASWYCGHDTRQAVRGADVVYTDVWTSMGQEHEAERRRRDFRGYQVTRELLELAKPEAVFMHCLPAHRGVEVAPDVIDSPRSIVFQQAENRLHVQVGLLGALMGPR